MNKHIVCISFGMEDVNFDVEIKFQNENYRVTQYSTNFDIQLTEDLIKKYNGECDAICLSGLPNQIKLKNSYFSHPESERMKNLSDITPTFDGQQFKSIYVPYSLEKAQLLRPDFFHSKKMGVYSGALCLNQLNALESKGHDISLADLYFFFQAPKLLKSSEALLNVIELMVPLLKRKTLKRSRKSRFKLDSKYLSNFLKSDLFVGAEATYNYIDLEHLKGKDVVVDILTPSLKKKFKDIGVNEVFSCVGELEGLEYLNFAIIEALIYLNSSRGDLYEEDIVSWIGEQKSHGNFSKLNQKESRVDSFAFIIHPLSRSYLFKHPLIKKLPKTKLIEKACEDIFSMTPGFFFGQIDDIKSEKTGKSIKGLIYAVTDTPRKLMTKDPETVYSKLTRLCHMASERGASIIGLGAYTKIVGDAGVTINKRSPIPVTTGNSLSACSTLWAAKYGVEQMNFVQKKDSVFQGSTMIVGATGSIGAVSAKVLAKNWKRLVLVAPRMHKLLELKDEILRENPNCLIDLTTNPDELIGQCDLVITSTSAQGKKILDIEQVKSGAVICDVSRPFDISKEDTLKRPDVMVMASGEVLLPGNVEMKMDIGLEGNLVYACLAETALLALEGRLEPFTLSRRIDYKKIIEIDKMAKEHGVKLASIMGHHGTITKEEFRLCREHAIKKRES